MPFFVKFHFFQKMPFLLEHLLILYLHLILIILIFFSLTSIGLINFEFSNRFPTKHCIFIVLLYVYYNGYTTFRNTEVSMIGCDQYLDGLSSKDCWLKLGCGPQTKKRKLVFSIDIRHPLGCAVTEKKKL